MNQTFHPGPLVRLRSRVPCLDDYTPLNHCSQAPVTVDTLAAIDRFTQSWKSEGMDWDRWLEEVEGARRAFARIIDADPVDVAVFSSVSHATAAVASALDFRDPRSRLVLTEAEFPTVAHVWGWQARRGAELVWAPVDAGVVDAEALVASVDDRTRLVSVAHGHYESGALLDVRPVLDRAREHGALTFLDAYQTLGTHHVSVKETAVDFLAAGALKYLMGVAGIAFLYVRPGLADVLEPGTTGWFGRVEPFAFDAKRLDWAEGARRFDSGTPPILPAYVARAGMELLLEHGVPLIQDWVTHLGARMIERGRERGLTLLGPEDAAGRTANTAFDCGSKDSHQVEAALRASGFIASARGRAIRLAPHGYTTEEEVLAAVDRVAEC